MSTKSMKLTWILNLHNSLRKSIVLQGITKAPTKETRGPPKETRDPPCQPQRATAVQGRDRCVWVISICLGLSQSSSVWLSPSSAISFCICSYRFFLVYLHPSQLGLPRSVCVYLGLFQSVSVCFGVWVCLNLPQCVSDRLNLSQSVEVVSVCLSSSALYHSVSVWPSFSKPALLVVNLSQFDSVCLNACWSTQSAGWEVGVGKWGLEICGSGVKKRKTSWSRNVQNKET